jgi:serine protease AprX
MEGTSMATPLVAGCAAVLREALTSRYHTYLPPFPSAALIKALLINGADILEPITSNFLPSNESGHGRVNIANAIAVVHGAPGTGFREKSHIDGTSQWLNEIDVEPRYTTLKATLV